MNDRIKLAEAMGWREIHDTPGNWYPPGLPQMANALGHKIPDPFTDANDDYAVLEWMRNNKMRAFRRWDKFVLALANQFTENYKVGDYARAVFLPADSRQECDFLGGACSNPAISETMLSNSGNWYACCDLHAGYARRAKAQFRDLPATDDSKQENLEAGQCPKCKELNDAHQEWRRKERVVRGRLIAEIEHYENAMREIQAATSDKVVLAITDEALCDE